MSIPFNTSQWGRSALCIKRVHNGLKVPSAVGCRSLNPMVEGTGWRLRQAESPHGRINGSTTCQRVEIRVVRSCVGTRGVRDRRLRFSVRVDCFLPPVNTG